jgi:hypothetical protein
MLSLLIYGVIMLMFAVSLRRPAKALIEARRQHANLQRALAASDEVGEDPFRHLTPPLARLAEETRVLRSLLEEPIQAALAWRSADDSPILSKVDFGDGSDLDRCDDFDVALVNARQAVWSWISAVAALPEADRMRLDELGLSDREARALLGGSDGLRRVSRKARQELARIEGQLRPLMSSLERFESGLARSQGSIYR